MRTFVFLFCATVFGFVPGTVFSQKAKIVIETDKVVTVDEVFDMIKKQTNYTFIYQEDLFKNTAKVHLKRGVIEADHLLKESLSKQDFDFSFTANNTIVVKEASITKFTADKTEAIVELIKGKVTDDKRKPLAGVTVSVKGTKIGTVTNESGEYSISAPKANSILIFSYVGFAVQEVAIGNQSEINIVLKLDTKALDEIVVVGYGNSKKKDVTGAVKSIKSSEFNKGIINSAEQLLQGKVSGVNVVASSGEPGAPISISVRGPGGVRTGSTPLFVVDGLALDNSGTGGIVNPLSFLNSQDIETIDVLKDASATAIYGARGANGVILISTKKGKAGTSVASFSSNIGISTIANPLKLFTADEFRVQVPKAGGVLEDLGGNTDWQKAITRTAITQNYNFNLSGGSEKLIYYASFGTQKQEGIIKKNDFNKYSGRINVTQKLLENRLMVDASLNFSNIEDTRPPINTLLGNAITLNPTYPAYGIDGLPAIYPNVVNPLIALNLEKDVTTINRIIASIAPSFKISKNLTYKLNYAIDNTTSTRDVVSYANAVPFQEGRLESIYSKNTNSLLENYLTYSLKRENHDLSVLLGHSYQKIFIQERSSSINKFPITDIDPIYNPGLGQDLTLAKNKPTGYAINNELQSYFTRVNYQFYNKYLLTATIRADGSSKFGANNKYGYFPSFSAGWKISEEEFMKSSPFSNLKLRAGWGLTGNQEIPSKITQPLFTSVVSSSTSYPLNSGTTYPAGTTFSRLANPDIKWEVSTQYNLGLDFGLFNGALTGSVDVFNKVSKDILLEVIPADPIQPAGSFWTNVRDMKIANSGVELELNYRHKGATGFNYEIGANTTFIKNEIKNSPYSVIPTGIASGTGLSLAAINGYISGQPIGAFYLREFTGFDSNGLSTYKDADGDGVITDKDRIFAGTALPNVQYNFFASASFKGFDFSVNFNGVEGNKLYDNTANANFFKVKLVKGLNTTAEATAYPQESIGNPSPISTRYLKNASFLRLNNLSVGYTLDTKSLRIDRWITALRLSITGQNLWVLTSYDGYDPEVNTDRNVAGISSYGIDYLSYPKAKTFVFGFNVSF